MKMMMKKMVKGDVHLTQMPKTDKQKRSEKGKKEKERAERKQLKRNRDLVEEDDEEDGLNGKKRQNEKDGRWYWYCFINTSSSSGFVRNCC
jgi:hypothetical protein